MNSTARTWIGRWWVGVAAALALGLGAMLAMSATGDKAFAQEETDPGAEEPAPEFTVTPQQLRINQRISQASVRRSNRSLNYLAPIRTEESDAADDGTEGVRSLDAIPGAGEGWNTGHIADGAITGEKLSEGLREASPRWAVVDVSASPVELARTKGAEAVERTATGEYAVTFNRDVTECAIEATVASPGDSEPTMGNVGAWHGDDAADVMVRTDAFDATATPPDFGPSDDVPFHVTVLC